MSEALQALSAISSIISIGRLLYDLLSGKKGIKKSLYLPEKYIKAVFNARGQLKK
jgi:hypothetical protein